MFFPKKIAAIGVMVTVLCGGSLLGATDQAVAAAPQTYQIGYHNKMIWSSFIEISWNSETSGKGAYYSEHIVAGSNRAIDIPSDAYDIDIRFFKADLFLGKGGYTMRKTYRDITGNMCMTSWGSLFEAWASVEKRSCWS